MLKKINRSFKRFNIFHSLILALLFHFIFFLFFKSFAGVLLDPSRSLYEIKPPEKEMKFTFVQPEEEKESREQTKLKNFLKNRKLTEKVEETFIMPEGKIPLPKEETAEMLAKNTSVLPSPKTLRENLKEPQMSKADRDLKESAMMKEDEAEIGKIKDQKDKRKIPITRKDLLSDFFVKPPETGSSSRFSRGLDLEGGFSPNLTFETKDFNWTDYATAIYWAIWRSWHNRLYLSLNNFERWSIENDIRLIRGVTGVTFVIEKNGNISEITPLFSSEIEPLDESAIDALREAVLPPLPANFYKERERVTARFIADTDVKAMKHWLPIYKGLGLF